MHQPESMTLFGNFLPRTREVPLDRHFGKPFSMTLFRKNPKRVMEWGLLIMETPRYGYPTTKYGPRKHRPENRKPQRVMEIRLPNPNAEGYGFVQTEKRHRNRFLAICGTRPPVVIAAHPFP